MACSSGFSWHLRLSLKLNGMPWAAQHFSATLRLDGVGFPDCALGSQLLRFQRCSNSPEWESPNSSPCDEGNQCWFKLENPPKYTLLWTVYHGWTVKQLPEFNKSSEFLMFESHASLISSRLKTLPSALMGIEVNCNEPKPSSRRSSGAGSACGSGMGFSTRCAMQAWWKGVSVPKCPR